MKYIFNSFLIVFIPTIFILLFNLTNNWIFIFLFIISIIVDIIYLMKLAIEPHVNNKNFYDKLDDLISKNKFLVSKWLKTKENSEKEIREFILKNKF